MRLPYIILIVMTLWSPLFSFAGDIDKADKLYEAGDFEQAVAEYKGAVDAGAVSPELYYDLGNAAWKAGQTGLAVLSYERARRLDPGNDLIDNNLAFVTSKVEDANRAELHGRKISVSPDAPSFFQTINRLIAYDHTSDYWSTFAAMSFVLLIVMIALYVFASNVAARKVGFFGSAAFLFFSIIFLIFSFMAASRFEARDEGVIMGYKVSLLQEPDRESKTSSAPLTEGTKVNVLSSEKDPEDGSLWYKIRLNSDYIGWIHDSDFEII